VPSFSLGAEQEEIIWSSADHRFLLEQKKLLWEVHYKSRDSFLYEIKRTSKNIDER